MIERVLSTSQEVDLISRTLDVRDPNRATVAVGSAAIVAQFQEYKVESPVGCENVDVLCPQDFFDRLLRLGPHLEGIGRFSVRWPKGRLRERGAINKSIDIHPREDDGLLKFTACYSMSDLWYAISYDSCQNEVVRASDIKCLRMSKILEWIAVVGRDKDLIAVEQLVPLAYDLGMITTAQKTAIKVEARKSEELKKIYPERYYSRVDL